MIPLFRKEISSFFSSLTAYVVIGVFLTSNGLFLWVFPGELNLADKGLASIDSLFILAPWVFLFLVPAITMRLLSEEFRSGTMELLVSRPLTGMEIILSKYFAAIVLVLLSIAPALICFISVFLLGDPPGNIDAGGTAGSFIGLFCLASIYVAIGLFASSLTTNQVVSFLFALVLSFLFYTGFGYIGSLPWLKSFDEFILMLGIEEHYQSLSRGVIDSRDVMYFLCFNVFFLLLTKLSLQSRKW